MGKVHMEKSGEVVIARLDNGPTNMVNLEVVQTLSAAIREIENYDGQDCAGMVLAGGDKFFSIGLALPELLKLNRSDMTDFWYQFNRATLDIYTLPLPTACAIAGHAPAAGAIWACACDFRFAAEGRTLIGLNEIQLGIPTPFIVDLMLRQIVTDRAANDLLYTGKLVDSQKAKELSLVDGVRPKPDVEKAAIDKIQELAGLSRSAFGAIKAVRNEEVRLNFEKNHREKHEVFLDHWFGDQAQKLLNEALKHF